MLNFGDLLWIFFDRNTFKKKDVQCNDLTYNRVFRKTTDCFPAEKRFILNIRNETHWGKLRSPVLCSTDRIPKLKENIVVGDVWKKFHFHVNKMADRAFKGCTQRKTKLNIFMG